MFYKYKFSIYKFRYIQNLYIEKYVYTDMFIILQLCDKTQ